MPQKKILILYTELAGYTIKCLEALAKKNVIIHIVHYPINSEAPFNFSSSVVFGNINYYNKTDYNALSLIKLCEAINPNLIYCAGWSNKDYLQVIKQNTKKRKTILGFDNKWFGSLKQHLSCLYARCFLTPHFNYAFVPGKQQFTFAEKLGFKKDTIISDAYSADVSLFNSIYEKQLHEKQLNFPQRFIYIGRYYDFKGIKELWQAFIELQTEMPNNWELWCLGVGDLEPVQHPQIKHFGFVQPKDLELYLSQTSVFILPSRFEPWGVVVHEMAAAGFPLLLSNQIGAKEAFLNSPKNGFEFEAGNTVSIKNSLKKIIETPNKELMQMGNYSHTLAQNITPEIWAERLIKLID